MIPVSHAHEFYAAAHAPKELWIVDGANHWTVLSKQPQEFNRRVTAFLARYFPLQPTQ